MVKPKEGVRATACRRLAELLYARALRGVTVFQNTDQMRSFTARGWVRPDRAVLIRGAGVDLEAFSPAPLPEAPICVLPARMLWDKGVGELVEAARSLRGKARFALVGGFDPENRAAITRGQIAAWVSQGAIEHWGHREDTAAVFAGLARGASRAALASFAASACIAPRVPGARPGRALALAPLRASPCHRRQ